MKSVIFFLSGFGTGFLPKAPGTFGSLLGSFFLVLSVVLFPTNLDMVAIFFAFLAVFLSVLGVFFLQKFPPTDCKKNPDQQWITLDEIAGVFVASIPAFFAEKIFLGFFLGFVLFRFFDILKPLGIKKIDNLHTPFSVFADDLLAGIYSALFLWIIFVVV